VSAPAIYNLGSLNLDRVLRVPHIAAPGETLAAHSMKTYPGGKGANQSVALARAGASVVHIGRIGVDGQMLRQRLAAEGVDVAFVVETPDSPTGQALIQVDDAGQNSIVILAGANGAISPADIEAALAGAPAGGWLLVQNETSCVGEAMQIGKQRGMRIAFNPAPADERVCGYPVELVDLWCLNETEHGLLHDLLPRRLTADQEVLLTRGAGGAALWRADGELHLPAEPVEVVDTTAAGDTFLGYYLASLVAGLAPEERLRRAIRAAASCVTRPGAIDSIPRAAEV
jgi:ribokinase